MSRKVEIGASVESVGEKTSSSSPLYEFTVRCKKIEGGVQYKVKRTYAQFLEMEEHVVEMMDRYENIRKRNTS